MSDLQLSSPRKSRPRSSTESVSGNSSQSESAETSGSDTRYSQVHIIGESSAMLRVYEQTRHAAATDATVVISGETGTGKELIAIAIHQLSRRARGPLVDVNIAAMPSTLVESELFGHVKGAFTSATADRIGCFEAAHGGTLFIDEIGELELASQAKLLRALETHRIRPVGSNNDRIVDVRIVAATNRPLEEMIEAGGFRRDLYYRLNIVTIYLPSLRERRSDIPLLISFFLDELAGKMGRDIPSMDRDLMEFLVSYDWPGNVRQLRNCLESMLTLSTRDHLTRGDIPHRIFLQKTTAKRASIPADVKLDELERQAIEETLVRLDDDRTKTARALGISVRTLQRKLKRWSL